MSVEKQLLIEAEDRRKALQMMAKAFLKTAEELDAAKASESFYRSEASMMAEKVHELCIQNDELSAEASGLKKELSIKSSHLNSAQKYAETRNRLYWDEVNHSTALAKDLFLISERVKRYKRTWKYAMIVQIASLAVWGLAKMAGLW